MAGDRTPTGNVGDEIVFENDKIRVWNFELAVGEETEVHTHEHEYMWYAIAGTYLQTFDQAGNDVGTLEVPTGAVYSLNLENGYLEVTSDIAKGASVPATHSAKNVGTTPYREVLVEYK